ncbi:MAG: fibronectin type III domain-containing protein [Coriobacteriia bacterium]|nr:fibronectin type III domain-containing protein [Coriobacteriia bacterium]
MPRPLNKADFEFVGYVDDESLAEKYAKVAGGIWDIEITAGGQVVPSKLIDAPFGSTEVTVKLGSRYTWADGTRDLYKTTWNLRGRADKPPAGYNLDKGTGDERFWEGLVNQRYYRVLFDQGTPPSTLDEMTFGDHVVRFILNDHCEWKDGTIDEISGTWSVRGVVPVPSLDLSFVAGSQAISTWAMSAIQNVNYAYSSDELSFKMADQWMPGVYDISVKPAAGGKWNDTYGTEERTVTLTVLPRDLANAEVVIAPYVKKYDGTPRKPGVTVRWNGQDLVENVDYKVSYSKNVNAGTARVNIFGIGLYESTYKVVGFEIDPAAVSASKMALGKTVYTYTGKAIKPAPVVTYGDAALVAGQDYTVTYSGGCKSAGVYKATVTCTGNYSGSKTFTFRIKPKAACVKKATAGKGKVTVTLGGKPAVTGGTVYQISYRAKGAKTWKTVKTTAGSKTIKQLKKGKRYYVKARAYKKVGSTVLYGSWSKAKLSGIVK